MKQRKRCADCPGSLTVEASLVMTLVLLAVFSMLVLTLWLRDRTAVTLALCESLYVVDQGAEGTWEEALGEMCVISGQLTELLHSEDRRTAAYQGETCRFWPGLSLVFSERVERRLCRPAQFLRICQAMQGILPDAGSAAGDALAQK